MADGNIDNINFATMGTGQRRGNVNILVDETSANYRAAINYYDAKKRAFLNMINQDLQSVDQDIEEIFTSSMNEIIEQEWQKISEAILDNATKTSFIGKKGGQGTGFKMNNNFNWTYINDQQQQVAIPEAVKLKVLAGMDATTGEVKREITSQLGFAYEAFIASKFSEVANKIYNNGVNSILSQFNETGNIRTSSSIRANGVEIRPDIGFGFNRETGKDENNLSVELQSIFDIQSERRQGFGEGDINNQNFTSLQQYINSKMTGFSLKRWDYESNKKELTQSTGMQRIVNQMLDNQDGELGHQKKTWSASYAYNMMLNTISRFLIDILGPVNIGYFFGNKFVWAGTFIGNSIFLMNIYSKHMYKDNEGNYTEIKPYVNSNKIYRIYAEGRGDAFRASFSNSDFTRTKDGGYYNLSFKIT